VLRAYLVDELLPLWWEHGLDRERGGFWNALTPRLEPTADEFKRLRVQTRQIYVFCEGLRLGAGSFAREAADAGFAYLCERYWDPAGGWHRTLTLDGQPLDRTLSSYECAFVLLALAHYHRATGETEALRAIDRTLDLIDARLLDPNGLGYLSSDRETAQRHQNPQMHLLEAFLALFELTGASSWRARAEGVVELFRWKLFEPEPGCIGELFGPDWSPAPEPIEPGHQFEWAWLLARYANAASDLTLREPAERLFAFGTRHGVDGKDGGVYDRVERDGRLASADRRLWPQLEQVQALAVRAETSAGAGAERALRRALAGLFERWRQPGHAGWYERLSGDGRVLDANMPATSVYHVVAGLADALRAGVEQPQLAHASAEHERKSP
jgi:mannose-6-phosphate isomerase